MLIASFSIFISFSQAGPTDCPLFFYYVSYDPTEACYVEFTEGNKNDWIDCCTQEEGQVTTNCGTNYFPDDECFDTMTVGVDAVQSCEHGKYVNPQWDDCCTYVCSDKTKVSLYCWCDEGVVGSIGIIFGLSTAVIILVAGLIITCFVFNNANQVRIFNKEIKIQELELIEGYRAVHDAHSANSGIFSSDCDTSSIYEYNERYIPECLGNTNKIVSIINN